MPFTIATYNIHSCIGTDKRFAPDRILQILKELDADVIALQEVGWHRRHHDSFDQYHFFEHHSDYQVIVGPVRHHPKAHFGNAILTRLPATKIQLHDITVPRHTPRGAIEAAIEVGDQTVTIINAHLSLTPWERHWQLQQLRKDVLLACKPALLLGDLNSWKQVTFPLKQVQEHLPHCAFAPTYPAHKPRFRFDRMYYSEELACDHHEAVETQLTRIASDHLPLLARFTLAK